MHVDGDALGVSGPGSWLMFLLWLQRHMAHGVGAIQIHIQRLSWGTLAVYHHLFSSSKVGVTTWYGCPAIQHFPASLRSCVAV